MRRRVALLRAQLALDTILALAILACVVAVMFVTGHLEFGSAAPLGFLPFMIGATNEVFVPGQAFSCVPTDPAVPASGGPCVLGQLPGVATTAQRTDGTTSVRFDGVWNLSCRSVNNAGGSAIVAGDILYYNSGATPKINKDSVTGGAVRYGYALDPIAALSTTATIRVKVGF